MAVGDFDLARFNEDLDNFQVEDSSVINKLSALFPSGVYDDLQYNLIHRSGGGDFQRTSIVVTGVKTT